MTVTKASKVFLSPYIMPPLLHTNPLIVVTILPSPFGSSALLIPHMLRLREILVL